MSKEDKTLTQIIIFALLYLLLIFTAQSWISTFNSYYQKYIIKKEKLNSYDYLVLSIILTIFLIFVVYMVKPRPPLFK